VTKQLFPIKSNMSCTEGSGGRVGNPYDKWGVGRGQLGEGACSPGPPLSATARPRSLMHPVPDGHAGRHRYTGVADAKDAERPAWDFQLET